MGDRDDERHQMGDELAEEVNRLRKALQAILNFKPHDVVMDASAYKRLVGTYRKLARAALIPKREQDSSARKLYQW